MNWEPIETVPRRKVVLMWGETGDLAIGIKNWKMETGVIYESDRGELTEWGGNVLSQWDHKPTHWMPLPEPPNE